MPDTTIRVNPNTGEVYEMDEESGVKLRVLRPGRTATSALRLERPSDVPLAQESDLSGVTRFLGTLPTVAGGSVGSAVGGLPGMALGTIAGGQIQRILQGINPDVFGEPPANLEEEFTRSGTDIAGNLISDKLAALARIGLERGGFKQAIANAIMRKQMPKDVTDFLKGHNEIPIMGSQAEGSKNIGAIEQLLAPFRRRDIVGQQQEAFEQIGRNEITDRVPSAAGVLDNRFARRARLNQEVKRTAFPAEVDTADVQLLLKKPNTIKELIKNAGDSEGLRKAFAARYLSNIQEVAFREGRPVNINVWRKALLDPERDSIARTLFNAPERAHLEQFIRTMERLDPAATNLGLTTLAYTAGRGGLMLAGSVAARLLGGTGAITGVAPVAMIVGGNQFVKKVLLDDKVVRIATKLAKLPPQSQMANYLSKGLFLALKGTQVYLQMPDGTERPAVIDEKGKIQMQ